MRVIALGVALAALITAVAHAESVPAGSYTCSVEQRAGIGATHLGGDSGPQAFVDAEPAYRFRITLSDGSEGQRVVEAPYDGPGRSRMEWHTPNSTLHAPYVRDGNVFRATGGEVGFLQLSSQGEPSGRIRFYLSAFEYPGGEDKVLAVRYGHCERE